MKQIIRPISNLFLLLIGITVFSKAFLMYSYSFRLDKIKRTVNQAAETSGKFAFANEYKLIGKGRQCFVFESSNGSHVIKFIRYHRYDLPFCYKFLAFFNLLPNYSASVQNERNRMYENSMNSYKLAYDCLQEETATEYIHLDKTHHLNKKVKLKDKLNNSYKVNLDEMGFIVQKKAKMFMPYLEKDQSDIEHYISTFFENINSMYKKRVINEDRHVVRNLGIIDKNVVEIDIGKLSIIEDIQDKKMLEEEIVRYTKYFRKWLSNKAPKHLSYFDEKLNQTIKSF